MPNVLIIGASKGLGDALVKEYSTTGNNVFAITRGEPPESIPRVTYIGGVDVATERAGPDLISVLEQYNMNIETVIITAGYFGTESFDEPSWEKEVKMYTTSSIAPVFLVHHIVKAKLVSKGSKIILVSSESGSITLRHESEGGGNYGHHASKAALNMVGKLLSLDLKDKGIAVGIVHPGFMRTEMTKSVGFDKFWEDGGAVTPDEAASSLIEFIKVFDIGKTGEYWAPRGPG
ncbi:MAG: hypothetical protein L6R37_002917 [Teloschistes peruensis]|nr:MAG: hypothetical protein L6R37_002917 [Teloschistes peruensis]